LLKTRNLRIPPGLDDKIITAWNAMMITGLTDAYKAFDDKRFLKAAILNMRFLENEIMDSTMLYRSYKDKRGNVPAFLDDYAALIQSQIKLYEVTFDEYWIKRAEAFTTHVMEHFYDDKEGYFYYTSNESERLLSRKKELFDNVIPASNSIMAWNLFRLGTIFENEEWKAMATRMTMSLSQLILNEPYYMSNWAIVYTEIKKGLAEVAFVGDEIETLRQEFHIEYQPFVTVMGTRTKSTLPLLADKEPAKNKPSLYVCFNKTCYSPVHSIEGVTKKLSKL
jgi:uncharacterized protein